MNKNIILTVLIFCFLPVNCSNPVGPENSHLRLIWQREFDKNDRAITDIRIYENSLYFLNLTAINGKLFKLSKNNKQLQILTTGQGTGFGTPEVDNSTVYTGTDGGHLYAVDKTSMKSLWVKHGFAWVPVASVDESYVYVTEENKIHSYDKKTGNEIWSKEIVGKSFYNSVTDSDKLYFATGFGFKQDGYLYCFNKYTGTLVFQVTIPYMESRSQFGGSASGVEIWNDYVYVPGENRYLYCFNKNDGNLVWRFLADSPMENVPRVSDGILYVGSLNRTCYAIDATTGKLVWSYQQNGSIDRFPPSFYEEYVLFSTSGNFLILNKRTGEKIVDQDASDGYSYLKSIFDEDGKIYTSGWTNDSQTPVVLCYQFF